LANVVFNYTETTNQLPIQPVSSALVTLLDTSAMFQDHYDQRSPEYVLEGYLHVAIALSQ